MRTRQPESWRFDRKARTGSVEVTVETASIATGDPALEKHLRSADFFNIEKFPTLSFKSKSMQFANGEPASVSGDFTMLGVTKPVTLRIARVKCGMHPVSKKESCGAEVSGTINSEAVYVFVTQGAGKQWTLRENQYAWADWAFEPHRMGGVVRDKIDTSVTLLGEKLPYPILVTPFGSHGLHHPQAEVATARGAGMSGALSCFSSASTASLEDIAKASTAPKWFQMYLNVDEGLSREVLQRVPRAGFKAVILTVDAIGQGSSEAYVRTGKARPWLPYGNFPSGTANAFKTNLSWSDVEMIRKVTGLPVIVKGITRADDALAAIRAGAGAIQVSNHGGRALDGTPAAITVLPRIADAVKGQVPIILDSGIRRGTDVATALALGANAVAVGRPLMYALALGGAKGVDSLLKFLRTELVETMLHLGVSRLGGLDKSRVIPAPGGRHAAAPAPERAIAPRK